MLFSITSLIIIITVIISISAFQNTTLMSRFIFSPSTVARNHNEWYRFFSSGFLHGGWLHLLFNMYVLWMFGGVVEQYFKAFFAPVGGYLFLALYLLALPFSETASYIKHRDNFRYASLGASGAVSAIVFAFILFEPTQKLFFIFIPIGIPAFIFGPLYLAYSAYMAKQNQDNIGHDAHFWGAVFGFVFPLFFKFALLSRFIQTILG